MNPPALPNDPVIIIAFTATLSICLLGLCILGMLAFQVLRGLCGSRPNSTRRVYMGRMMRERRELYGYGVAALAERIGIPLQKLLDYEQGRRDPPQWVLDKIESIYASDIDSCFRRSIEGDLR